MIGHQSTEFYGDQIRWFIGIVEQVGGDIPKLGRVRVRIFGIHAPDISLADLPYAQVVIPSTEAGVSGIGRSTGLGVGATVFGIFMDGKNSQLPLVIGSIPKVETPTAVQLSLTRGQTSYSSSNVPFNTNPPTVDQALLGPPDGEAYSGTSQDTQKNTQIAWDWFMRTGRYSKISISAMLGNFLAESGMSTTIKGDTNLTPTTGQYTGSVGIAQWYAGKDGAGARQKQLKDFAAANGKEWYDLYLQLAFVDHELSSNSGFRGAEFKAITDLTRATVHFRRYYENPASLNVESVLGDGQPKRLGEDEAISFAFGVYENFASGASNTSNVS